MHSVGRGRATRFTDGTATPIDDALDELVERERAVRALDRALERSREGRIRIVLVEGALGTGKSALVWRFLEKAESRGVLSFGVAVRPAETSLSVDLFERMFQNVVVPNLFRSMVDRRLAALRAGGRETPGVAELVDQLRGLAAELLDLAELVPLLLVVDDVHQLDTESVQLLLNLLPPGSAGRVLVVFTADGSRRPAHWRVPTELLLRPNFQRVQLHRLSEDGVRRVARGRLGESSAADSSAELVALSAGNPLVLGHLLRSYEASADGFAEGYGEAVVECLHRCPPETLAAARALAVLGEVATPKRVAELAGADANLAPLTAAGLLAENAYRHPSGARAVLADVSAEDRAALHRRAAQVLHDEGLPALDVARHLVPADEHDLVWTTELLLEAADEALTAGHVRFAVDCLTLANRATDDPAVRAAADARLGRLEWQLKPLAAARHLRPQLADGAQGRLSGRDLLDLVWRTAWFGNVDDLGPLLGRLAQTAPGDDDNDVAAWLALTFPMLRLDHRATPAAPPHTPGEPWLHAAATLARGLIGGQSERADADADLVLQSLVLDHDSLWSGEAATSALLTLVYTGHLDAAIAYADRLLDEVRDADMPAWHGVLTAVRGEALFRQGDLPGAYDHALAALDKVPAQGWGAAVGLPLGCALHAAVRMGDMDTAKRLVGRPLPEIALRSRYGLHYLHARGHYRMAQSLPQAALADFLACGTLTERWGAQSIDLVPWRTSAAEAWSRNGNADQARRLLRNQLAVLSPGNNRARGQAMRVLACVSRDTRRAQLLSDAVDVLKDCGDKYELARALTDLSVALRQAGDQRKARRTARRALHFAKAAGAEPLAREVASYGQEAESPELAQDGSAKLSLLTGQELRVAALAVEGDTNHEIAEKLYITPSTVEQHLTRIFRKLDVKRRDELPHQLDARRPNSVA